MAEAARLLEGEHDFAALQGAGSAAKTTTRTVTAARRPGLLGGRGVRRGVRRGPRRRRRPHRRLRDDRHRVPASHGQERGGDAGGDRPRPAAAGVDGGGPGVPRPRRSRADRARARAVPRVGRLWPTRPRRADGPGDDLERSHASLPRPVAACKIKVRLRRQRMSLEQILARVPAGSPEEALARQIDFSRLPAHVAIIMDGNGRWAAKRHLPRVEGHRAGIDAVRDAVEIVGPARHRRPHALRVLGRELEAAAHRGRPR